MSDLNIRMNLETSAAEAKAAEVKDDLAKLRTDAEKPVKIAIAVDAEAIKAASAKSEELKKNLENMKSQALGELTEAASQFAEKLGGVEGKIASIAVKSLSAFGPVGQQLGAVLGIVALTVQAFQSYTTEQDLIAAKAQEIANATNNEGVAYESLISAINGAKTAEELNVAVLREKLTINQQIAGLLQGGTGLAEAQQEIAVLQQANKAHKDISVAMMETALHTGNAAVQQQALGFSFVHSTNAIEEHIRIQQAVRVIQARNAEATAAAARAANQIAVNNRRAAREALQDAAAEENNTRGVANATRDLRVANAAANAAFIQMNATEAESNRLHREGEEAAHALAATTTILTEAEKARDDAERRKFAQRSSSTAETEAQRRAGMEALRVAEQGLLTAGQEISVSEQQTRAEQALAFAVGETTRARAASARGGQTTAERTALVGALNAEATARQGVAEALERQANAQRDLKSNQIDIEAKEQTESNRAFAEWARNRNTTNQEYLDRQTADATAFTEKKKREHERENSAAEKLAKEQEDRNESLKQSAGGLAKAQIHALLSAAIAGESAGAAAKAALGASLASLAEEAAMKSLYKLAEGFGYLATPGMQANATAAFTSAAIFGSVAVGAGLGAIGIGAPPEAKKEGAAGGAGAGAGAGATPMRSSGGGGGEAPKNITINFSAFQSNEQAQALIVRSLREAGYNGRARVGSSFSAERR